MARRGMAARRETDEDRWIRRTEDLRKHGPRMQYEDLTHKLGIRYAPSRYTSDAFARKIWRHAYRVARKRALHGRTR